jgi:DNA (cytosine-5)-methyltransferase 1
MRGYLQSWDDKPVVVDLFSGAGGLTSGFEQAGITVSLAIDNHEDSADTYRHNHTGTLFKKVDLKKLEPAKVKDYLGKDRVDLIIGGPPCQGFSSAGKKLLDDPRNQLVIDFIRMVEELKPTCFLMENVEGMLTSGRGELLAEVVESFIEAGYTVGAAKLNAVDYGVPQFRKRVFIMGNSLGIEFEFPRATHSEDSGSIDSRWLNFDEATSDLPEPASDEDDIPYISQPTNDYQASIRNGRVFVTNHRSKRPSQIQQQRIDALPEGGTMWDLPQSLWHPSYRRRAYRRVMDGTPSQHRGGPPAGLRRLISKSPSTAITGSAGSELVHPKANRFLTVRECARIQSFVDNYCFFGPLSSQYWQIGNAVPPLLARALAFKVKAFLAGDRAKAFKGSGRWLGITGIGSSRVDPPILRLSETYAEAR